jgi:hypothetical protein
VILSETPQLQIYVYCYFIFLNIDLNIYKNYLFFSWVYFKTILCRKHYTKYGKVSVIWSLLLKQIILGAMRELYKVLWSGTCPLKEGKTCNDCFLLRGSFREVMNCNYLDGQRLMVWRWKNVSSRKQKVLGTEHLPQWFENHQLTVLPWSSCSLCSNSLELGAGENLTLDNMANSSQWCMCDKNLNVQCPEILGFKTK